MDAVKNAEFAQHIIDYSEKTGIDIPDEGYLSPLIENRLLKALHKIGKGQVWVSDEFGNEKQQRTIKTLIENDEIPHCGYVYTEDQSILITTHWDSHCSYLCSSKETNNKILEIDDFEGFFATDTTEVF